MGVLCNKHHLCLRRSVVSCVKLFAQSRLLFVDGLSAARVAGNHFQYLKKPSMTWLRTFQTHMCPKLSFSIVVMSSQSTTAPSLNAVDNVNESKSTTTLLSEDMIYDPDSA